MDLALIERLRTAGEGIVADGFSEYELKFGKFTVSAIKTKVRNTTLELLFAVLDRIETDQEITALPLKQILLEALFELEFDGVQVSNIVTEVFASFYKKTKLELNYSVEFVSSFKSYEALILEALSTLEFFSSSSVHDVLQDTVEYQYSSKKYSFIPQEIDESRQVFTLFPKERYWERFSALSDNTSYSPFGYNRSAVLLGFPQYQTSTTYEDLIIYEDKLYKLNPTVRSPKRDQFVAEEWVEYSPRRFDRSKSFSTVYKQGVRTLYTTFLEQGFDINEIISDSDVKKLSQTPETKPELLSFTFGGQGKQVYDSIRELEAISEAFGGYEGSPIGGIEYITQYMEYLLASAFGRGASEPFDVVLGSELFGKFDLIFTSKLSQDKIPGLSFLDVFGKLKSFVHKQTLPKYVDVSETKIIYNPVYVQFYQGLDDWYSSSIVPNTYSEPPRVDLLLYGIETLYKKCLIVGDNVKAILNLLVDGGKLPGFEGLGSIEVQMKELQNVFPPALYFLEDGSKLGPGLTGGVRYLLDSYSRLSKALVYPELPGKALSFFPEWINEIYNRLEELISLFKNIGIGSKDFIPNLSFKQFDAKNTKLIQFLSSLGFRDSEISQLLNVESFEELINNFAPLSNSSDLKSFFKAYELSQLIYEFGGDAGVSAYLSFLYSASPVDSLLNILSLSQKDRSAITSLQISKYPKLIGLLIGLTYAIDPAQLIKFNKILGENNLTLLESIGFLYQSGERTLIKSEQDISLLEPVIEQIIRGNYSDKFASPDLDYSQTNSTVPIALKQWTELIGDNLGKLPSTGVIKHLYDKSVGITPKELISILNNPTSSTPFGELIDGFSGGEFTQFLRYANVSGLAIKLSYYKNSYQADNFFVDQASTYFTLPIFIENLEKVLSITSLVEAVFEGELDFRFGEEASIQEAVKPLVYLQNKTFDSFSEVIRAISPPPENVSSTSLAQNPSRFSRLASEAPIAESPGIGNSRLPNRIPALNSITPEQFRALFEPTTPPLSTSGINARDLGPNLINNFIKFSDENKLINSISQADEASSFGTIRPSTNTFDDELSQVDETFPYRASQLSPESYTPATPYETQTNAQPPLPIPYSVPPIYSEVGVSGGLGSSFIPSDAETQTQYTRRRFDPVEACRRFGGANCESLYEEVADRCVKAFNKSLFPEQSLRTPGSVPNTVLIDRPLGTFAQYNPRLLFSTSAFDSPPAYYSLLGEGVVPGRWGEPIMPFIMSQPLTYESGNGAVSEYGNTEYGIVEFIKAKLEKNTEFSCATFDSPFYYGVCMNIMKCKKFAPPSQGEYFLKFCPKTLSGGRLK
jgi:hypothetical protein